MKPSELARQKANAKKEEVKKEVKSCGASGCPLKPANGYYCSYHEGTDIPTSMTQSIQYNIRWIRGLNKMTFWDSSQWYDNMEALKKIDWCPFQDNEIFSMYLYRYHIALEEKIKDDAIQIDRGVYNGDTTV